MSDTPEEETIVEQHEEAVEEKALVVKPEPQAMSITEAKIFALACYESNAFDGIKSEAQALVKIMAGQELGIPPVQAINKLYIVQGKIGMGVEAMGTLLVQRGYQWDMAWDNEDKPTSCRVTFTHNGRKSFVSRFTIADAKRAGLIKQGGAWEKYPKDLLYARAFSGGARKYAPEALSGCGYTPEELRGIVVETVVEDEPTVVEPSPQSLVDTAKEVFSGATEVVEPDAFPELSTRYGVSLDHCWLDGHDGVEWFVNKFGKRAHKQGNAWCNFRDALKPIVKELCEAAGYTPDTFTDWLKEYHGATWSQIPEEKQVVILESLIAPLE